MKKCVAYHLSGTLEHFCEFVTKENKAANAALSGLERYKRWARRKVITRRVTAPPKLYFKSMPNAITSSTSEDPLMRNRLGVRVLYLISALFVGWID